MDSVIFKLTLFAVGSLNELVYMSEIDFWSKAEIARWLILRVCRANRARIRSSTVMQLMVLNK